MGVKITTIRHDWILMRMRVALVIGLSMLSAPKPAVAATANPGDVVFVEVGADPPSSTFTEPAGEFIEVYNATASDIDVGSWKLCDNSSGASRPDSACRTIPSGTTLGAGKILVIIHATSELGAGGYNCSGMVNAVQPSDGWFSGNVANSSDFLELYDTDSNKIDAVSYGGDLTAFDPSAPDVFNNTGRTLQRQTYNSNFTDTDTANDWAGSTGAGSPCDVGPTVITLSSLTAHSVQGVAKSQRDLPAAFHWPGLMLGLVAAVAGLTIRKRRRPH